MEGALPVLSQRDGRRFDGWRGGGGGIGGALEAALPAKNESMPSREHVASSTVGAAGGGGGGRGCCCCCEDC